MSDRSGDRLEPSNPSIGELAALLARPEDWAGIDPDHLRHLLFYACVSCGVDPDALCVERLTRLVRVGAERLHPAVRLQVVVHAARAIERVHRQHQVRSGPGATTGLLPFVLEDPDPTVVSAAACELAILLPPDGADPLSGPKQVASLLGQVASDEVRAGIIGGLLSLGDSRVEPLVRGAWARLDDDGRQTLALLVQGFHGLHVLTVTFLLGWLEGEVTRPDSATFGMVAATMARAGRHAAEFGVVEVRRAFPVMDAPEDRPYEVTRQWGLDEFLPLVSDRLQALAAGDDSPELIHAVLRHWGLGE